MAQIFGTMLKNMQSPNIMPALQMVGSLMLMCISSRVDLSVLGKNPFTLYGILVTGSLVQGGFEPIPSLAVFGICLALLHMLPKNNAGEVKKPPPVKKF